jgi:hypothetical protein
MPARHEIQETPDVADIVTRRQLGTGPVSSLAGRLPILWKDEAPMNIQLPAQMDKPSFLAWLQGREGRFELVGGRVLMMTGGTMAHGLIVGNVFKMLRDCLDPNIWAVLTDFGVDVGPRSVRYPMSWSSTVATQRPQT